MKKILGMMFGLIAVTTACYAGQHPTEPYAGSAAFERLKQLEGKWTGTVTEGGKTEAQPTEVVYEVTSGKSAIVEKLFAGTPHEMVSVYNDEKGGLVMTHYCMMQNQPKLKLKSADENQIALEFFEANGVTLSDSHMHALAITFEGPDSMKQEWYGFENGKQTPTPTTVQLKRA